VVVDSALEHTSRSERPAGAADSLVLHRRRSGLHAEIQLNRHLDVGELVIFLVLLRGLLNQPGIHLLELIELHVHEFIGQHAECVVGLHSVD
jgi:hypothetical protein